MVRLVIFILIAFVTGNIYSENLFPVISALNYRDLSFKQYLSDVEASRRRVANMWRTEESRAMVAQSLTVYAYTSRAGDDLLSLAARCNIPYATLVSLNRISNKRALDEGISLLLPSTPGLFIPENPNSALEYLLAGSRDIFEDGIKISVTVDGKREVFRFIPGADFSPTERAFFLNPGFRYPLRSFRLTSSYGPRVNPVTGNLRNHNGLDLAAPTGTEVYATKNGVVAELGSDPVYGNYIVIQHSDGWSSLYGHLSAFDTSLKKSVEAGALIGRVGSTGQSTGPHLHFELRQNGKAHDPGLLLFKEGR